MRGESGRATTREVPGRGTAAGAAGATWFDEARFGLFVIELELGPSPGPGLVEP